MQTIYQITTPFDQLLKKQKMVAGQTYRPMYYVVEQPVDEGLLLYHTMTKAMLLLNPEEVETYKTNPIALPQLVEQWFLVPQSHDDRLLSRQIRDVAKMLEKTSDAITGYTILPTTDCNARCFYCYEMGRSKISMSMESANLTAEYIISHCLGEKVEINWFGGEPLFNKTVITHISQRLNDAGVDYRSTMVSNGYLFDDSTIKEAKECWNLYKIQITLDGTEKIYNRSKAYIYKGVNAYRRVLDNIHRLQDAGIIVRTRLNIDMYNADNLLELVEELHQEFSNPKGITVYMHPLFEDAVGCKAMYDNQKRSYIFQRMKEIYTQLTKYGFIESKKIERTIKKYACQADNDHCVVIMPSGHIGKCEHYTENLFTGHINHEGRDLELIASFKEMRDEIEACATCPAYPSCLVLKLCTSNKHCYEEIQKGKIYEIRQEMLYTYQQFQKTSNNEIQD